MKDYIKLLRVPQWIKNVFVFVPIIFSKNLFHPEPLINVVIGFFAFGVVSSIVYVFNDIHDREADRLHPKKKDRPLASGKVSPNNAYLLILVLVIVELVLINFVNFSFILVLAGYLVLNVFYSVKLKNIVILDLLCIAGGFMLRVLGGAFVIDVYVSRWLVLTTLFISLFLAVMKRKSELNLELGENGYRQVLDDYSHEFINQISAVSSGGVIISYALYTVADRTVTYFQTENLIYTTIIVVFGIFRYMYLAYQKSEGENTIDVLISDIPMIIASALYFASAVLIIYFG